jgi:hypothetical protein
MSLKIAAEHLKSKGRGPDTELIHMTKGEIKGLRQLAQAHGTDLTINPETGLPEAGMLMKILPMVAAAAATYFTAGAAAPMLGEALAGTAMAGYGGLLAGAGAGALIGGASAGLQGGDIGRGALFGGLGGALSGGLGAFDAAPVIEPSIIDPQTGLAQVAGPGVPMPQPTPTPSSPVPVEGPLQQVAGPGVNMNSIPSAPTPTPDFPRPGLPDLPKGQGRNEYGDAYELLKTPKPEPSYYSKLGTGMSDTITKAGILAAPGIGAQMGEAPPNQALPTGKSSSKLGRISPDFRAQEPAQPNPYYTSNYEDYKVRAAGGGLMDSAMGVQDGQTEYAGGGAIAFANRGIVQDLPRSSGADVGTYTDSDPNTAKLDAYNAALYRFNKVNKKAGIKAPVQFKEAQALGDVEEAASGGIMRGIGGYSDGGRMLKGPGDGMSDSIPAVIGKKQPARLADGEFVVPADVVSHLGNGSTDAGAKRLYGMMDKIRKARTGRKKQAPEVKTEKYLPA